MLIFNDAFSILTAVCTFLDAYPIEQVDYSWKDKDKRGIVILEDQMNEFTLREIKTRRAIVLYGTRGSSKYSIY